MSNQAHNETIVTMKYLDQEIINVIKYFSIFDYAPTLDEVYTFCKKKTSRNTLKTTLFNLARQKKLKIIRNRKLNIENDFKYTLGGYSIKQIKSSKLKIKISNKKLKNWRFRLYVKLISFFTQIKLVGLSGSISMMNANEDDDIDLFIITARNRLFTGRFISIILSQLLGLRRYRHSGKRPDDARKESILESLSSWTPQNDKEQYKDKVCLNLFFDERELLIPKFKQTEFVAHEALQMKPIINKDGTYERFLKKNKWIFKIFPNARLVSSIQYKVSSKKILNTKYFILNTLNNWLENLLKKQQMKLINRHRTSEIITGNQLWFHPDDFEKKIKI